MTHTTKHLRYISSCALLFRLSTLGNYGRSLEQLRQTDLSRAAQSRLNVRNIERQTNQANLQAFSTFAMQPYLQRKLPMPTNYGGPKRSGFNTALQIGQGLMGAANTAFSMLT